MEIKPLRGYRYTGDTTRDISTVVAPPYDQISPEIQDRLYALNLHNIVRVTYPKDAPGKYGQAREVLDAWLAEGLWVAEARPAIYPYQQTYTVESTSVTRTGFIALGEVSDYAERIVLPEFGTSMMLPLGEEVTIEVVPQRAGEFELTCQAGVLHGRLLVRPAGGRPRTPA